MPSVMMKMSFSGLVGTLPTVVEVDGVASGPWLAVVLHFGVLALVGALCILPAIKSATESGKFVPPDASEAVGGKAVSLGVYV